MDEKSVCSWCKTPFDGPGIPLERVLLDNRERDVLCPSCADLDDIPSHASRNALLDVGVGLLLPLWAIWWMVG